MWLSMGQYVYFTIKIKLAVMVKFKFEVAHVYQKRKIHKKVKTTIIKQLNAKISSHAHSLFLMYIIV